MKYPKHADGDRYRKRKATRAREESALVREVRARCEAREGGMCRVAIDGHPAPWCTRRGEDWHEDSGVRGMGGRKLQSNPPTTRNSVMVCHACHMAHHDGRFRIEIEDADDPFGVWYHRP